jgi:hypothetical protein
MDEQIDHMIAGNLQTSEMIIDGKGQVTDEAGRTRFIASGAGEEIFKVFNDSIIGQNQMVVKNEGNTKGIGIDYYAGQQYEQNCRKRLLAKKIKFITSTSVQN